MTRSTNGFCQGARGAMRTSWIPILLTRARTPRRRSCLDHEAGISEPNVRERLDDLLSGPDYLLVRDVHVEEFAALVAEHHEDEQEAKGQGWHEKEVDGDDVSGMRGERIRHVGEGRGEVRCMYLATVSSATA